MKITALALFLFALLSPARAAQPKRIYRDLTVAETKKMVEKKDPRVVVLDVRTPEEFSAGHIARAANLDFHGSDFKDKLAQLDKTKTYVVHCAAGKRSAKTMAMMRELEFQMVYNVPGGFNQWKAKGFPVSN